jgi:hypothetical protein
VEPADDVDLVVPQRYHVAPARSASFQSLRPPGG